jgi:nitrogenase molybdenum-iron protein NifN
MAHVTESKKACAVNPLKMGQPLGASYAFMGLASCMPLMHGSQGCTSFGVVLLVRHFKEAIPLQTSAMNEATTILGGYDNLEQALLNIRSRAKPAVIGICSTGLTETKGEMSWLLGWCKRTRGGRHAGLHQHARPWARLDGWARR